MASSEETAGFERFVAARSPALLRAAWLLTGDWHRAEDLLQTALAKAYLAWPRIRTGGEDAYVRRILVNTYATWWRRAWRGERPTEELPDTARSEDDQGSVELRRDVLGALARLTRRERATVVLRFYCDLSVAETAAALDCSTGTVKSQTSRALRRLRANAVLRDVYEGTTHD